MTLHRIEAIFDCDGCGHRFSTEIDPAYVLRDRNGLVTLYDVAVDSVRDGLRGTVGMKGITSVQGGLCLCPACTTIVDEHTGDDPTPEDVKAAIEKVKK